MNNNITGNNYIQESYNNNLYFFGTNYMKPTANLYIRKNHSNLFLTFTDLKGKVVSCITAARVLGKSERRRRRHAPQTISKIISSFDNFFNLYNVWGINICFKLRPNQYLSYLINSILDKNIKICNIFIRRKLPFSTQRGRRKKF